MNKDIQLFDAISNADLGEVELLVKTQEDANLMNEYKCTPLLSAMIDWAYLSGQQIDVNVRWQNKSTAERTQRVSDLLHIFHEDVGKIEQEVRDSRKEIVRFLITMGADVNYIREKDGATSLEFAIKAYNKEFVTLLLEHGMTVETVNSETVKKAIVLMDDVAKYEKSEKMQEYADWLVKTMEDFKATKDVQ